MAQEREYGAAQPVVDFLRKGVGTVRGALNRVPPSPRNPDTSWHDSMVRTAQESFRKAAEKPAAKARTAKRKKARSSGR